MEKYVKDAIADMDKLKKDSSSSNGSKEESVLQKLLRINRLYATLMVFDMIFAGIDTTSAASAVLLHQLAINPHKQAKLHEEVLQLLPNIDSPLTEQTLSNAPYFRACLKESMRMQPLVMGHLRATGQDLIINGYQIPKMVKGYIPNKVTKRINKFVRNAERLGHVDDVDGRVVFH